MDWLVFEPRRSFVDPADDMTDPGRRLRLTRLLLSPRIPLWRSLTDVNAIMPVVRGQR